MLRFGSLFAGIGGFDLGLERAGMECAWQVEIDDYARRVLAKHWPKVRRYEDICTFPPGPEADWQADIICGGFPCQDISFAGAGAGIDGERSGLWAEYARVIRLLRPRYVLVENVAALLVRGMGRVVGDLAACGYDAEWDVVPAAAIGAPHLRERLFLVAYPARVSGQAGAHAIRQADLGRLGQTDPDSNGQRREKFDSPALAARAGESDRLPLVYPHSVPPGGESESRCEAFGRWLPNLGKRFGEPRGPWRTEPAVGRVAHGVPHRVDRLRGLGNAVVPQVAEWIGRRIVAFEQVRQAA